MSIAITFQVDDQATVAIKKLDGKIQPISVAQKISKPLAWYWRKSLAKLPQNKRGFPSTGFWGQAADSVIGNAVGGDVILSGKKLGLRKRYYGGSTKAVNHANVTIPICAEANGTTVADWGFKNLVLVILGDGRKFYALWLGSDVVQKKYKAGESKKLLKWKKRKADAELAQLSGGGPNRFGAHGSEQFTREAQTIRGYTDKEGVVHAGINDISKKPKVIVFKNAGSASKDVSRAARHMNLKFLFRLMPETGEAAPMPQVIPQDLGEVTRKAVMEATK